VTCIRREKEQHTQNLNAALTDALKNWKAEEGPPNAILQFEATISPNPGGVSQYRCRLVPGPPRTLPQAGISILSPPSRQA
jgi:hypothetical protein